MIDQEVRRSLSQDVRRLITGRMTNDAFDEAYYETYEASDDRAVSEVASFCYGLYSSDLLFPYRLRGRHAVDDETRSAAARAVLFLRSGFEYEWPEMQDFPQLRILRGLALSLGLPAGAVLSAICIPVFLSEPSREIGLLALLGVVLLVSSIALLFWQPSAVSDNWKAFRESGDYEVWPFLRRADFDEARTRCHMFAQ
jgi:hypothetical protein